MSNITYNYSSKINPPFSLKPIWIQNDTISSKLNWTLKGWMFNYYKNGNHTHKDTTLLIVVNKKIKSGNGDIIVFGSSSHGIEKEETERGRISIALFLV